jgi:DNA processing protein
MPEELPGVPPKAVIPSAVSGLRDRLSASGIGILGFGEPDFPPALAAIPDPPLVLYYRGRLDSLPETAVAIVGARRSSRAGREIARVLAADLANAGIVVVSGLALGVDAAAHDGALKGGGVTIAVLGSGPDRIQPLANIPLAERILEGGGLIVSEYRPGTEGAPYRFPERNRLIAGLSRGVVVVEASERSGSLITARLAAEQGREVMAVPGAPDYVNSAGANRLLKNGAALVESAEDVLLAIGAELDGVRRLLAGRPEPGLTPEQQVLVDLLDGRAQGLDELSLTAGLPLEDCAVLLTELELSGIVQRLAGGYIRRPFDI